MGKMVRKPAKIKRIKRKTTPLINKVAEQILDGKTPPNMSEDEKVYRMKLQECLLAELQALMTEHRVALLDKAQARFKMWQASLKG